MAKKKPKVKPNDIGSVLKKAAAQRTPAEKALVRARKAGIDTNSGGAGFKGGKTSGGSTRVAGSGINHGKGAVGKNQIEVNGKVFNPKHLGGLAATLKSQGSNLGKWANANPDLVAKMGLSVKDVHAAGKVFKARDAKASRLRKRGRR